MKQKWHCNDDGGAELIIEAESAEDAAREYVETGDYQSDESRYTTQWITVSVWLEDGDVERIKITLEPEEPECKGGQEHNWQDPINIVGGIKENPGVWGHGGGVTIQEVCMRCGCGKLTDTWAQDVSDCQQGLRSVTYEPDKYADEVEDLNETEA